MGVLTSLIVGFVVDRVGAQSQDYLNGSFAEGIRYLNSRMDRTDNMLTYVLLAVVGSLISQVIQIRSQAKHRRDP